MKGAAAETDGRKLNWKIRIPIGRPVQAHSGEPLRAHGIITTNYLADFPQFRPHLRKPGLEPRFLGAQHGDQLGGRVAGAESIRPSAIRAAMRLAEPGGIFDDGAAGHVVQIFCAVSMVTRKVAPSTGRIIPSSQ